MRNQYGDRRPVASHACGWPTCKRQVPLDLWGCRGHWFTLPEEIRTAIMKAWRYGRGRLSSEWLAANQQALDWIREIPARIAAMNVGKDTPVPGRGELDAAAHTKNR